MLESTDDITSYVHRPSFEGLNRIKYTSFPSRNPDTVWVCPSGPVNFPSTLIRPYFEDPEYESASDTPISKISHWMALGEGVISSTVGLGISTSSWQPDIIIMLDMSITNLLRCIICELPEYEIRNLYKYVDNQALFNHAISTILTLRLAILSRDYFKLLEDIHERNGRISDWKTPQSKCLNNIMWINSSA